jgi:pimeloyl-ACP methyl ester carboxylesterase
MPLEAASPNTASSADGAEIAYWTTGAGPPLVLVHGAPADHTRWVPLLPHLEPHVTVVAMDRRGRGRSGDGPTYAVEREYEDVAAVVDAVAVASGSSVDVYGHSYGGFVAFEAPLLTSNIRKLVLYEGWPVLNPDVFALPADVEHRMDELARAGDTDGVIETMFRAVFDISDEDLAALKAAPSWAGRVAAAPALTRELRAIAQTVFDPSVAARIDVPVLLVTGETSGEPSRKDVDRVASAIPEARILELKNREHVADILEPELFARELLAFLHGN